MRIFIVAIIVALYLPSMANGQDLPYRLNADDVIRITVVGQADLSGDVLIPQDGTIALPWIGNLYVKGMTLAEMTATVTQKLKERLVAPEVAITVRTPRQQNIFISGHVRNPGVYALKPQWRLSEALVAAGGTVEEEDDCQVILVQHAGGKRHVIDLPALLRGDAGVNHDLAEGDAITVEAVERIPIFLVGALRQPGVVNLRKGGGVVEALAMAGGITKPVAELTGLLVRNKVETAVDLHAALVAGNPAANQLLQKNDLLIIKAIERIPVYVSGQIKMPGLYELLPGTGVMEALTQAGGTLLPAHDAIIVVKRNQQTLLRVSLDDIMTERAVLPEPLQRGDLLHLESRFSISITVAGKVRQPGTYFLPVGGRIKDALALAGGVLENGTLSQVTYIRQSGERTVLDLTLSSLLGSESGNVVLSAGDILVVPELINRVSILGYVNKPGYYLLPDGQVPRLADVLALAGGQEIRRGGIRHVAILRTVEGKEERIVCDLQQYFRKADVRQNPVVRANDIIFVPETNKVDWEIIFRGLSALGVVYGQVL